MGGNITYSHQFKMYQYVRHKWHIYGYQLQSFQTAANGDRFCSEPFGDNQYYLEVYPNGSADNELNSVICNVRSLQFPFGISKIECNISLQCSLNSVNFLSNYEFINYPHSGIGWKTGMISTKSLYTLMSDDIITFCIELQVLKMYDLNAKLIPNKLWSDYIIDTAQKQQIEKQIQPQTINTNKMLMDMVNQLQKEMGSIKQSIAQNEEKQNTEANNIKSTQQSNTESIESFKSDIICIQNDVKQINEYKKEQNLKKDQIFDIIIELRKDLEALKSQVLDVQKFKMLSHRRRSSLVKIENKANPFRDWLKSDDVGMEEYFPLFLSEGIESLDVACFLSEQDLIEMGIVKYGHIKTLCHKFKQYREGVQVVDAGCEGAGFQENIALPDFDVDNMPNAADADMKVADIHNFDDYAKQNDDDEKLQKKENKNLNVGGKNNGLMAFDPMLL